MNNLFLLNEALNAQSVNQLETGIFRLNSVFDERNNESDSLLMHESLWSYNNGLGQIVDFYYSIVSEEVQRLVPKVFGSFTSYNTYISTEAIFDEHFSNNCNAFAGINFDGAGISIAKQVLDGITFKNFKESCLPDQAANNIDEFWNQREIKYASLVFCPNVYDQIAHLSTEDARFKLICEKLERLNLAARRWFSGAFDYKSCGVNCSPDTPNRIEATRELRTFPCPGLGDRVFSLHAKWYFGSEPFRMYFFPDADSHRLYVGYIGDKAGIGF